METCAWRSLSFAVTSNDFGNHDWQRCTAMFDGWNNFGCERITSCFNVILRASFSFCVTGIPLSLKSRFFSHCDDGVLLVLWMVCVLTFLHLS